MLALALRNPYIGINAASAGKQIERNAMGIGWPQLLVIALVVLVLFGRGRISEMMGDFGKGIKSFKKGLNEDEGSNPATSEKPSARIEGPSHEAKPAAEAAKDPQPADKRD